MLTSGNSTMLLSKQLLPSCATPVSIFSTSQRCHSSFEVSFMIVSGHKKFSGQFSVSSRYGLEREVCNVWFWTADHYPVSLYIREYLVCRSCWKKASCTMVNDLQHVLFCQLHLHPIHILPKPKYNYLKANKIGKAKIQKQLQLSWT